MLPEVEFFQEGSAEEDLDFDLAHLLLEARDAEYERTYGAHPPLSCILARHGAHTLSLPHGLTVPHQWQPLTTSGVGQTKTRSSGSESGSSHIESDDGRFDSGDGHSAATSSCDSLDFFRRGSGASP